MGLTVICARISINFLINKFINKSDNYKCSTRLISPKDKYYVKRRGHSMLSSKNWKALQAGYKIEGCEDNTSWKNRWGGRGGENDRTDRGRECTSLPRSHVLYKTQSLHRCRKHRRNGENAYVCTLAQRRGQTSRNICFPSQYSAEERLQPINPRGNELFSSISLTSMLARPLLRNFRSVSLLPLSFVSRRSIFPF